MCKAAASHDNDRRLNVMCVGFTLCSYDFVGIMQASRPSNLFFRINMSDSISPAVWREKVNEVAEAARTLQKLTPPGRAPFQVGRG